MSITLTRKQKWWLRTQGGRTVEDVYEQNGKLCVEMSHHGHHVSIEIPKDEYLNHLYIAKGKVHSRRL